MSQQVVAKPQGVISEPNKVGQFPSGAFADCSNIAIRSFGQAEQVEKWSTSTSLGATINGGVYALSTRRLTVFVFQTATDEWTVRYFWRNESAGTVTVGSVALTNASGFGNWIRDDQRTGMLIMRNRLIIASETEPFAIDFIEDTATGALLSVNGPRKCGAYQPVIYDRDFLTTAEADGGVLGPNKHMSGTAIQRIVFRDGYELLSAPAMLWDFANLSTTLAQVPSTWTVYSKVPFSSAYAEHKLDVYRTREQSVGYDSINNKYLPVATGSSFYLSKTADRTAFFTDIVDGTLANSLGESLVTNVSVSGASAIPFPPTTAKTCAEFRGHAFYANREEPATCTLLSPYFWGSIPSTAPTAIATYGVGVRTYLAAAATNGSPTVTGLANTTGVVAGQNLTYARTDTGSIVGYGEVLSKTATTVTSTVNSTYTGSVTVTTEDVIQLHGTRFGVGRSASEFASNMNVGGDVQAIQDVSAVALEPQPAITGVGVYPGFSPTGGLIIRMRTVGYQIELRATNGNNYSPRLPEITETVLTIRSTPQPNGYAWSENNEPENCPASNFAFAGSGDIHKILATRDCLWFFCSDGLYRLSGNGGSVGDGYDWVLDPVDLRLVIHNPSCAVVHGEHVYAYTNRGLVRISSEGTVSELSDGRINPSSGDTSGKLPNAGWTIISSNGTSSASAWMTVDTDNDEIWLRVGSYQESPTQIWVYNTKTDTFCIRIPTLYSPREVPTYGVYSLTENVIQTVFSGRSTIHLPTNGSYLSRAYEEAFFTTQPIYGGEKTASHTLKHWQDIQFSFRCPQTAAGAIVYLRGTDGTQVSRTIPVVTGTPSAESARVGFTVWRNFPAMSNALAYTVFIGATTGSQSPVALEATSVNFIDFTTQRNTR